MKSPNLLHKTFGDLTVTRLLGKRKRASRVWLCSCTCGNTIELVTTYLTTGRNTHCGCKAARLVRQVTCHDCAKVFIPGRIMRCRDQNLRCKACSKIHTRLQKHYGISLTDYNRLVVIQGGVCAICKREPQQKLVVDHSHARQKEHAVRGLLCKTCNLMLGYVRDNLSHLRAAGAYLTRTDFKGSWDQYFLDLAELVATRSKDKSTQVGAVITKDRNVLATGYNGFPRGFDDTNPAYHERPEKYVVTIHGELNAILNANRNGVALRDATLYVIPFAPCHECAKAIIQSGIREVVVRQTIENPRWVESNQKAAQFFQECGVMLRIDRKLL